jgi:hypothetical protein
MFKKLLNALDIELNDDSFVECNGYGSVYIFHQGKETIANINLGQSIIESLPYSDEVPF